MKSNSNNIKLKSNQKTIKKKLNKNKKTIDFALQKLDNTSIARQRVKR